MAVKRRHFLMFLGAGAGSLALPPLVRNQHFAGSLWGEPAAAQASGIPFTPVKGTMPLVTDGIDRTKQLSDYSQFTVVDDLVLAEGYTYSVVASWGDPVGDSRFGYNNDYLSFVPTGENEGYLATNHEYISSVPWIQTYEQVIGKSLPFDAVQAAVTAAGEDGINVFGLADSDPIKAQIQEVAKAALTDLGVSVISIRREANGDWVRTNSSADRVISGASGLTDDRYLKVTGPAAAIFRKTSGNGYIDGLGDRIIGTFGNCSGGTTPWGTTLSAEENIQDLVPEPVHADGTAFDPSEKPFTITEEGIDGAGNVFGLAGNKYGWVVEVDPANPTDFGTKHTWLGRYRHEAVGVRVEAGQPIAFYSGCDRRGGHLYKFVSSKPVTDPTDKANSALLTEGMLYAAKFNPDGTGTWIPLTLDTPVNPDLASAQVGGMLPLPNPDRTAGGIVKLEDDAEIAAFKQQFSTLSDLYTGSDEEKQGAILIDAHFAANAAGATCTARPEDTDIRPGGELFITFTSGAPGGDGGPNAAVFKAPTGEEEWEYGWIMRLDEDNNAPAAETFKWQIFATGGEPADGGLGFANPDNLEFDAKGNLWMVCDMSSDKHNQPVPKGRLDETGKPISQSSLRGIYGNNSIWYLPTSGPNAGEAYLFGYAPMESEMTGPFLTKDQKTLFISAQHPGEVNGTRVDQASETREFALKTIDGQEFVQTRQVPIGSNWPGKAATDPPKPSVVAIRRLDGGSLS